MKKLKVSLYILIILTLVLPELQKQFHFFNIRKLKGAYILASQPSIKDMKLKSWLEGDFQKKFNDAIEQHIGFRKILIRIQNQIDYSFFNISNADDIIIGKDGYLYEEKYILSLKGDDFIGNNKIKNLLLKAKFLQDTLKKNNTDLILVYAPSKARFYPEYIPDSYKIKNNETTNFDNFIKISDELKLNYIDFNTYFTKIKDTSRYPLYSKCGTHWSNYGMLLCTDSLINYIEEVHKTKLPHIHWNGVRISNDIKSGEYDIEQTMNLLWKMPHDNMAYPKFKVEENSENKKLNLLSVADSYYWGIFMSGLPKKLFRKNNFWYYNKKEYPLVKGQKKPKEVQDLNLYQSIINTDVIVLLATECNLSNFSFGFIDNAYNLFKGNNITKEQLYFNNEIKKIKSIIRNNKKWLEKEKLKAKKRGISIEKMINKDAIWIVKQKIKKNKKL